MQRRAAARCANAFYENCDANLLWWEDAAAQGVPAGAAWASSRRIRRCIICWWTRRRIIPRPSLRCCTPIIPNARVTLLGDPMQRTCPGMGACDAGELGRRASMRPDAPVFKLSRCYRSTLPIARLCNALLPGGDRLNSVGREGEMPMVAQYSLAAAARIRSSRLRAEGHRVHRSRHAHAGAGRIRYRPSWRTCTGFDGGEADLNYESTDNVVGCYHLVKGMEFDAVIVVWPEAELTDARAPQALHRLLARAAQRSRCWRTAP